MTEIDHFGIMEKIATVLQGASLYNVSDKTKLMEMNAGRPDSVDGVPRQIPGGYVTMGATLESNKVDAKVTTSIHKEVRYDIYLYTALNDAAGSEEQLLDFTKTAKELLQADDTLTGSLQMSFVERIARNTRRRENDVLFGVVMTLKGITVTT